MTTNTLPTAAVLKADPVAAINFALDRLEPWEVASFLKKRRDGADMKPWLDALVSDRAMVGELMDCGNNVI